MKTAERPGGGSAPSLGQQVSLLSVPAEGSCTVRLLGPCRGILTHWSKIRPIACAGLPLCPLVTHRLSTCWKGYAPAELWRESPHRDYWPCVLEITERLWELLHEHTLRGQVWELFRVLGDHRRVEVSGRLVDLVDPRGLRDDVRVEPVVCRVYRTTDIAWDVGPVMPPRQVLGPVVDAPPPDSVPRSRPAHGGRLGRVGS